MEPKKKKKTQWKKYAEIIEEHEEGVEDDWRAEMKQQLT